MTVQEMRKDIPDVVLQEYDDSRDESGAAVCCGFKDNDELMLFANFLLHVVLKESTTKATAAQALQELCMHSEPMLRATCIFAIEFIHARTVEKRKQLIQMLLESAPKELREAMENYGKEKLE